MPPGAPNFGRILLAIKDGDESKNEYSQLISLINSSKRSEKVGFPLHEGNKVPILQLLNLLIHSSPDVRKEAVSLLNFCYSYDDLPNGPPQDIIDEDGLEKVEKIIFPGLSDLLQSSRDIYLLDSWDTIIRLLGTHLHRKTTLINAGMRVVQAAFKYTDARMVEKALRSWVVLMENFAIVPEILNSSKRIKLLVMALKYDNPKQQESTYRVRLECWYELMHLLGRNLKHHAGDLVKEFVIFCFGPKSGPSSRTPGTPRTPGSPASTPSSKLHGFGTPTKQMSPAKKFSSLERVCVDSLVQLFGARPLPQTLPRPLLSKPLPEVAITPQQFGELSEIILNALEEITENIKSSNRSENLKIGVIWSGVGDLAVQLTSLPNHLEPVLNYLRSVYRVSNTLRRQEKLHSILFEILGTVIKFPDSILLSHIYSLNSMEKKISPLLLILKILLNENILNSKEETKELHSILEVWLSKVRSPGDLVEVLQKMELVTPNLSFIGLDNMSTVWQLLSRCISEWEVLGENKGTQYSFGSVLQFIRYPLQFLGDKDTRFWRDWANLYSALSNQGEVTVGYESGQICSEVTEILITIFKSQENEKKGWMLINQGRCIQVLVENIIFSAISRELKHKADPLAGFRREHVNPIGPVTRTIQHLNHLAQLSLETDDSELSELVLSTYSTLLSRVDQLDLIKPLLKLILPKITNLLGENSLKRLDSLGLHDEYIKMLDLLAALLENKFSHTKDTDLLEDMEELLIQSFQSSRSKIKNKISEVWTITFSSLSSEDLPKSIKAALKKYSSPGVKSQVSSDSSEINTFPSSSEFMDTTEPGIEANIQTTGKPGTPLKNSLLVSRNSPYKGTDLTTKSPVKPPIFSARASARNSPGMKAPWSAGKGVSRSIEDDDSCNFVPIKPKAKAGRRKLTEHQKEVLTARHDDIPALYSELSRDDSNIQLPSQFLSQPSFDDSVSCTSDGVTRFLAKKSAEIEKCAKTTADQAKTNNDAKIVENGALVNDDVKSTTDIDANTEKAETDEYAKSAKTDKDTKSAISEVSPVEEKTEISPSQSLLSDAKASLKSRKNKRFEPEVGKGKRKRTSLPETSLNPARKKTRRELQREIFGDSQSSQSETDEKEEKIKEKEEANSESSSVEVITPEHKDIPSTIDISSAESCAEAAADKSSTDSASVIEISSSNASSSTSVTDVQSQAKDNDKTIKELTPENKDVDKILEKVEDVEKPADPEENQEEDELIGSSQESFLEDNRTPSRRSRRSGIKKPTISVVPEEPAGTEEKISEVDNKRNKFGETQLHQASKRGDVARVKVLLSQGANPDVMDNAGWFPLHELSISKKKDALKIMKLLIDAGCSIDCTKEGLTPLHEAISIGNTKQALALLQAGAKTDMKTLDGLSCIELAAGNKEMLDILEDYITPEQKLKAAQDIQSTAPEAAAEQLDTAVEISSKKDEKSIEEEPTSIPDSQEINDPSAGSLIADMDVDLQSQSEHSEYRCTEEGCTVVYMDRYQLSYHLKNKHSHLIKPDWMDTSQDIEDIEDSTENIKDKGIEQLPTGPESIKEKIDSRKDLENDAPGLKDTSEKTGHAEKDLGADEDTLADKIKDLNSSTDSDMSGITPHETITKNVSGEVATGPKDVLEEIAAGSKDVSGASVSVSKVPPGEPGAGTSPESNKENQNLNPNPVSEPEPEVEIKKRSITTLQEKNEKKNLGAGKSRGAMLLNLSRRKAMENRPATMAVSPSMASPKFSATPWAKYSPSPSHASPSASILKRKCDTPSSTEGSPISGKRRRVHFNEDPVSESVEIPRTIGEKGTRKKLKLSDTEMLISREYSQDIPGFEASDIYQESPPLDVSRNCIFPELVGCDSSVSELISQLVGTSTWVKVLEVELKRCSIRTVGDLASQQPADLRSIKGLKPIQDVTVKNVLANYTARLRKEGRMGFWKKKSPVVEITSQEEEEKIKEALFNGPSPSPTDNGLIEMSPIKIVVNSATTADQPGTKVTAVSGLAPDTPEKEEEPLAVRVERLSRRFSSSPLTSILEKVKEKETEPEPEPTPEKVNPEVEGNHEPADILKPENSTHSEPIAPTCSELETDSSQPRENQSEPEAAKSEPGENLADPSLPSILSENLETVMSQVSSTQLQQLSKSELGLLLQKTVAKHKQISDFLAQVSVAMATKPDA